MRPWALLLCLGIAADEGDGWYGPPGWRIAGRCAVQRRRDDSEACHAVRCAEDFVARNGYTRAPARGIIRNETLEFSGDLADKLRERRGTLRPLATGHEGDGDGHLVVFTNPWSTWRRTVTMTSSFDDVTMQHQDRSDEGGEPPPDCR